MMGDKAMAAAPLSGTTATDAEAALMARYGITRIPADQFHVDGYRYSSLSDALAQARRGRREDA